MFEALKRKINSWIEKREKIAEAKQVYRNCRGTNHKKMLRENISRLNKLIKEKEDKKEKKIHNRRNIKSNLRAKQNKKAFKDYFEDNYSSIGGVGKKYSTKILSIIKRTSDSQWSNLEEMGNRIIRKARNIKGIGQKTSSSLKNWHNRNKNKISKLSKKLGQDKEVFSGEKKKVRELKKEISDLEQQIDRLNALKKKPVKALEKLRNVSVRDFTKAVLDPQDHSESARKANRYLKGFYPPWGDPPSWYSNMRQVLRTKDPSASRENSGLDDRDLKKTLNRIKRKSKNK